jgi:hypothetical protein
MFANAVVVLCVALILVCAKHWMRVTGRDRDASRRRKLRDSIDWHRPVHRSRIAAGVSRFGELRGQ